jgi:hypothetical protein
MAGSLRTSHISNGRDGNAFSRLPRWVKVSGIAALVIAVAFIAIFGI